MGKLKSKESALMDTLDYDVAIVGGGIVGLSHAWGAVRNGQSVVLLERDRQAQGASVRNFGMIWPIGQAAGLNHTIAMQSRALWLEFARQSQTWVAECGSIHLAHRQDEWAVLQEFARKSRDWGYDCELLTPQAVLKKTPAAQPKNLQGGLWSPTELAVNPRQVLEQFPKWLTEKYGVRIETETLINLIEGTRVVASDGRSWNAERIVVCGGADFQTLYPEAFVQSGLKRCKLQMLRTVGQPNGFRIGPHLASGLTLRHYENFATCESLAPLKERIQQEAPELNRFGIHVMVSQNAQGEIIMGDSHEYDDYDPFDNEEINTLMLRELRKVVALKDWTIEQRWHGVYSKHAEKLYFEGHPEPNIKILTAVGGAGMTLSFGLAEHLWKEWGWSNATSVSP